MKATPDELADIGITNLYDVIMEHPATLGLHISYDTANYERGGSGAASWRVSVIGAGSLRPRPPGGSTL